MMESTINLIKKYHEVWPSKETMELNATSREQKHTDYLQKVGRNASKGGEGV